MSLGLRFPAGDWQRKRKVAMVLGVAGAVVIFAVGYALWLGTALVEHNQNLSTLHEKEELLQKGQQALAYIQANSESAVDYEAQYLALTEKVLPGDSLTNGLGKAMELAEERGLRLEKSSLGERREILTGAWEVSAEVTVSGDFENMAGYEQALRDDPILFKIKELELIENDGAYTMTMVLAYYIFEE